MRLNLELPNDTQTIILDPSEVGHKLTAVMRRENLPLNTRCGERLLCRSCTVDVLRDGEWQPEPACTLTIDRDMTVRVPQHAMLAYNPQILTDYRINIPYAYEPLLGAEGLAVAIDIGTTTVALSLVDQTTGAVRTTTTAFNRQMHFGDDVLTRINLCLTDPNSLSALQEAIVVETILPLLEEALKQTGLTESDVRGYLIAGNSTMLHLLAGVDPSPMGYSPFTPRFIEHREMTSDELGLKPSGVQVHLLPGVAAYVGADITGGVLASGLVYDDGPSLLVDVGTNGEIVMKLGDRMVGCATAAGPAFEGSGLKCGIRAGDGAISHVSITRDPFTVVNEIIGPPRTKPIGICGSAYIDFLAEGSRSGLLNRSGRIQASALPEGDSRVTRGEYGYEFVLGIGQGKRKIVVSEPDIARLLQAKAAIAAGIMILLGRLKMKPEDVKTLYLAGGFGMHLNIENAIHCGLFPGFHPDQVQLVGNTSLAGATLSAIDASVLGELDRIGREIDIVELNLDPDFEDTYIDQLVLGEA
ncbi:MAG: ASKHA domain-containing protein [Fimbriimonas sp.]|nr:ASKHA domain-containing protein [Fimbriimonas sp.]